MKKHSSHILPIAALGILLFFVTLLPGGHAKASNPPIAYLGFETSDITGIDLGGSNGKGCCNWVYSKWSNNNFRIPLEGDRNYIHNWISSSPANRGNRSLGVELKPPPSSTYSDWKQDPKYAKQRIEFELANGNYNTQYLDDSRYYGFALYIHPQSDDVLKKGLIFMQAWQSHDTSDSKQPPFALRFEDGTDYKWAVRISNDIIQDQPVYISPTGLAKGVWHEFIVRFRPSVSHQAAVQVWHNGILEFNISQSLGQNIGYASRTNPPIVNKDFAVRFGAYHRPEPDKPTHVILMYDQAKYGTSYESVDP